METEFLGQPGDYTPEMVQEASYDPELLDLIFAREQLIARCNLSADDFNRANLTELNMIAAAIHRRKEAFEDMQQLDTWTKGQVLHALAFGGKL